MKRDNRKRHQTPEQIRSAANDAIAFLHSMVALVDKRGWREVHFEFATCILCAADTILNPDPGGDAERVRLDTIGAAEFLEGCKRVPTAFFKSVIAFVERDLREDVERAIERISNAEQAA